MTLSAQAGRSRMCPRRWPKACAAIVWIILSIEVVAEPGADTTAASTPAALSPALATLPDLTNPVVPVSALTGAAPVKIIANSPPENLVDFFTATNGLPRESMSREEWVVHLTHRLEMARYLRTTRQPREAEPLLIELLGDRSPEFLQQSALLELAVLAQDQNDLARAQEVYAQFLNKWPNDPRFPEILLRQGLLFRQMGLYNLAFTKFYGVMTSALLLKSDQLDYYVRLVLQAQIEIAETQYELGRYADAAEFFSRLLRQPKPAVNESQIIYKLARCNIALRHYADAASEAEDFLARCPDAPEQPEIRFYLALALKELGRNSESLQQVLLLLQEQRARTKDRPELWAYWQQRAGNLIANQLYQEGDYTKALGIYLNLAQLDPSPQWQLPVLYQIGITYERLWQPQKAAETYTAILDHEKELGTNAPPGLKTVFDMTRWRTNFIQWLSNAEAANRQFHVAPPTNSSATASLSATAAPIP